LWDCFCWFFGLKFELFWNFYNAQKYRVDTTNSRR